MFMNILAWKCSPTEKVAYLKLVSGAPAGPGTGLLRRGLRHPCDSYPGAGPGGQTASPLSFPGRPQLPGVHKVALFLPVPCAPSPAPQPLLGCD